MPTATLSINRTPMALPTSRGLNSAQGQVQRKSEERAGSSSVYMWGNSKWPRVKNQQLFSFVPLWQGCRSHWPNGGPGRRDSGQSFKESPPYLISPRPSSPSSLPGWQRVWSLSILWKYLSSINQTYVSSCLRVHFSESCSMEQAGLLTLKVGHLSLGASVPLSVNEASPLTLPCSLRY